MPQRSNLHAKRSVTHTHLGNVTHVIKEVRMTYAFKRECNICIKECIRGIFYDILLLSVREYKIIFYDVL